MAQRSHIGISSNHNGDSSIDPDESALQESEMVQAFEAQKLVNRQLESELTAITEENNNKIYDLNNEIDELRAERNELRDILHDRIRQPVSIEEISLETDSKNSLLVVQNRQNIEYLMQELKSVTSSYAEVLVWKLYNENYFPSKSKTKCKRTYFRMKITECPNRSMSCQRRAKSFRKDCAIMALTILLKTMETPKTSQLTLPNEQKFIRVGITFYTFRKFNYFGGMPTLQVIIHGSVSILGIFKFRSDDMAKLIQRTADDLTPRVAITLYPGLSSYICFMCIR